ncbi:hypothetical protein KAH94_00765 [bacterium]|nr:hypothetical protein [bacterium]
MKKKMIFFVALSLLTFSAMQIQSSELQMKKYEKYWSKKDWNACDYKYFNIANKFTRKINTSVQKHGVKNVAVDFYGIGYEGDIFRKIIQTNSRILSKEIFKDYIKAPDRKPMNFDGELNSIPSATAFGKELKKLKDEFDGKEIKELKSTIKTFKKVLNS